MIPTAAPAALSISDRLRRLGYGHRGQGDNRPRIIFRLDTGDEVGRMFADEAVAFLGREEAA
jgi:hypothetical protein